MIAFLKGVIASVERDAIVIDVGGIGYRVFVSEGMRFLAYETQSITIHTHYVQREDHVALYGFVSLAELRLFRQLIDVTGIGPRGASVMLGGAEPQRIAQAIQREDLSFLTKLPGIGKKTAQRIVLELREKVEMFGMEVDHDGAVRSASEDRDAGSEPTTGSWSEVKEALSGLGYSEAEISRLRPLVQAQCSETDSIEQWVKSALQIAYQRL